MFMLSMPATTQLFISVSIYTAFIPLFSSNILLDRYNTPKLSDFGLAKECQSRPNNRTTVSRTSRVAMGTVAYMAPELLRNAKPSAKTDVWAFGVVMLELYTGKPADDPSRQTRALVRFINNCQINCQ